MGVASGEVHAAGKFTDRIFAGVENERLSLFFRMTLNRFESLAQFFWLLEKRFGCNIIKSNFFKGRCQNFSQNLMTNWSNPIGPELSCVCINP